MPPKRRAREAIDLTSDDAPSSQPYAHSSQYASSPQRHANSYTSSSPYRAPKQARHAYDQAQRTASGSSQVDAIVIDEEEDDANADAPDATQGHSQQHHDYILYGNWHQKVVGVRYYQGYVTEGEMVVLQREPNNQYDANAVRVLNVQGDQIGHLPRTVVSKLVSSVNVRAALKTHTDFGSPSIGQVHGRTQFAH
jgi:SWI/SNF-related matrix-associated actin-dependent regulator of chromatin subfamily A3